VTAPVVFFALLFWAAVFMIFFTSQGSSPAEFFLGRYEALPRDLGSWRDAGIEERTGLLREERLLLPGDRSGAAHLVRQVRYRDPVTCVIARVEPEQRVRRRRERLRRRR
jgi:hypothetical protein